MEFNNTNMKSLLPSELILGVDYIINIICSKDDEIKFTCKGNFTCKGKFHKIHENKLCTLFEFRAIQSKRTKTYSQKIFIDPYATHMTTKFYDGSPKTLQQICWDSLIEKDKNWLKENNHSYQSSGIELLS